MTQAMPHTPHNGDNVLTGPFAQHLLYDPDMLHAYLSAALERFEQQGDARELRAAVQTACDVLAPDGLDEAPVT